MKTLVLRSLVVAASPACAPSRAVQGDDHPIEGTPHFVRGPIQGEPDPEARD
jgi:hypothetical protein